ncbi:MAG TPA: hypothetical protein VMF07_10530 [Solirubrobacteraceae bacterium]|nr:hypothetical protein [Solirubrobacteraceae bacterium]
MSGEWPWIQCPSEVTQQLSEVWIGPVRLGPQATFVRRHRRAVTALVVAISVLSCVGLSAIAGWHAVRVRLDHLSWWFIPLTLIAHLVAYVGYLIAHHGVVNRSRSVPVGWGRGALMVVIGFGAWLTGGGFAVDRHGLEWTGFDPIDADIVAVVLSALELALLTPAAWLCALLLVGNVSVPQSATIPWVIGVPVGFALAIAGAIMGSRQTVPAQARGAGKAWRELLVGLAAALQLLRDRRRGPLSATGIAIYWAADIAALWAALRFVSVAVPLPRLVLAYATGYLLTRRTLPFAGVVVTEGLMAVALVWVGVPLAAAVPAVLVYRLSDFALTLGSALGASSAVERGLIQPSERVPGD